MAVCVVLASFLPSIHLLIHASLPPSTLHSPSSTHPPTRPSVRPPTHISFPPSLPPSIHSALYLPAPPIHLPSGRTVPQSLVRAWCGAPGAERAGPISQAGERPPTKAGSRTCWRHRLSRARGGVGWDGGRGDGSWWPPALFLGWPLGSGMEPAGRAGLVPTAVLAAQGEASPTHRSAQVFPVRRGVSRGSREQAVLPPGPPGGRSESTLCAHSRSQTLSSSGRPSASEHPAPPSLPPWPSLTVCLLRRRLPSGRRAYPGWTRLCACPLRAAAGPAPKDRPTRSCGRGLIWKKVLADGIKLGTVQVTSSGLPSVLSLATRVLTGAERQRGRGGWSCEEAGLCWAVPPGAQPQGFPHKGRSEPVGPLVPCGPAISSCRMGEARARALCADPCVRTRGPARPSRLVPTTLGGPSPQQTCRPPAPTTPAASSVMSRWPHGCSG